MGKTILISGASGDIGKALAKAAVKSENVEKIALHYNKSYPEYIENLKEATHKQIMAFKADLSLEDEVLKMFCDIEKNLGFVDILINNAGISQIKLFDLISLKEWDDMFSINLKSAFLCSKRAVGEMIRKKEGTIINISSIWGMHGASCETHYSASKAGLIGMTKALAKELAPSNIRVNCISPGAIEGKMNSHLSKEEREMLFEEIPMARFGKPCEVASLAKYLWEEASYITGQNIAVSGGL